MRDILTVLACLVILVLGAAIVAPPFIDWEARRALVDEAIAQATGTQAHTAGRIGLRLLPTPRLRVDRLRLGSGEAGSPSLDAEFVWSEIALTPLLRGEVRFLETRVGRADIRIPIAADGGWQLPTELFGGRQGRDFAVDRLLVAQLLVTTQVLSTGRTDQAYAEQVAIEGQKLAGPWRLEGTTSGVPFRLVTGEIGPDRTVNVKLAGGLEASARFEVDGKLTLGEAAGGGTLPSLAGRAKVQFGQPSGQAVPVSAEAGFRTAGRNVELDPVTVELGQGVSTLRLAGGGRVDLDQPRVTLNLEARRLDADTFFGGASLAEIWQRLTDEVVPEGDVPLDLDLSLASVGVAQEELSNLVLSASFAAGRPSLRRLEFVAPGETRVSVAGLPQPGTDPGFSARVALTSEASDRFARFLEKLGGDGPLLRFLDGRRVEGAADIAFDPPNASLRNIRIKAGEATIAGSGRYGAPGGGARGRLEAQLAVQGLDLDQLPGVSSIFDATQNLDIAFSVDARNVRAGTRGGAGRIAARIVSDGPALRVESLDIVDLAGANARVSGRILPDGSGRIAGKVTAPRAAPLVDLLGTVWIGGVSKLVPAFLREGDLDLDIVTERAPPERGGGDLRLKTTARGRAAGGGFEAEVLTLDGLTQTLDVLLTTENTGRWIERPDLASLRRRSSALLHGTRIGSGRFGVTLAGDLAGVRIATASPFSLSAGDDLLESGEAQLTTADIGPFLALFGEGAVAGGPTPVDVRLLLSREGEASLLQVNGKVAGGAAEARLAFRSRADVSGTVSLERLSLPWFLSAFALGASGDPRPGALWPSARFGQAARVVTGGEATIKVGRLDLGREVVVDKATFTASALPDSLALRDFEAGLNGGRLRGSLAVTRQGSLASVVAEGSLDEVPIAAFAGPTTLAGRLSGTAKLGASAETVTGLVTNLGGSGEARITNLQAPGADPAGLTRAVDILLGGDDPLAPRRAETVLAAQLSERPLTASAVTAQVAVVGGALRLSPFIVDGGEAVWRGAVGYDWKTLSLDARGTMTAKANPRFWIGAPPAVGIAWKGPLARPLREIDAGPLSNALAAIVLQRELERVEAFETEANERLRRTQQRDMDRQRERDRIAAEEAARVQRLRDEQERQRLEAERRNAPEPVLPSPSALPELPPPIDIRPPPSIQVRPGG